VPGLGEFEATTDSEASDAESPRFKGDAGAEAPQMLLVGYARPPWNM